MALLRRQMKNLRWTKGNPSRRARGCFGRFDDAIDIQKMSSDERIRTECARYLACTLRQDADLMPPLKGTGHRVSLRTGANSIVPNSGQGYLLAMADAQG